MNVWKKLVSCVEQWLIGPLLDKAYYLIQYCNNFASENYYIKEHSWNELILLLKKDFTKLQSHFMFQMLDWEQKGQLDVLDFLNIAEALKLHYTLKDADTAIENTEIGQFAR